MVQEEKGRYYATNGYQLLDGKLDDYPDAVIQCAVFKGVTRNIFITRKEFSGCIDEEIESAYAFVLEHIDLGARIDGLVRQDIYELPIRTIREMITNAVCHRSYLCPGKVQVSLFDDRLEVTSPGMLDKDLTIDKMRMGISKIRNGAIAKIFAYMNMVEAWGTGIPKMFDETKAYGLREPELLDMGSDFRINLYRKELQVDSYGVVEPQLVTRVNEAGVPYGTKVGTDGTKVGADGTEVGTNGTEVGTNGTKVGIKLGSDGTKTSTVSNGTLTDELKLISTIREDGTLTQKQMSQITGLSLRSVKRMTVELQKKGKIIRIGNSRSGKWQVNEP